MWQHLEELQKYIAETDAKLGEGKGGVLSVNQIELHPWLQRKDIIDWCHKHGVLVQAWGPLAQADRWNDPALRDIAQRTGKTEAQVLLRWSLQKVSLQPLEPCDRASNPDHRASTLCRSPSLHLASSRIHRSLTLSCPSRIWRSSRRTSMISMAGSKLWPILRLLLT